VRTRKDQQGFVPRLEGEDDELSSDMESCLHLLRPESTELQMPKGRSRTPTPESQTPLTQILTLSISEQSAKAAVKRQLEVQLGASAKATNETYSEEDVEVEQKAKTYETSDAAGGESREDEAMKEGISI